jgi:hypothetical protein
MRGIMLLLAVFLAACGDAGPADQQRLAKAAAEQAKRREERLRLCGPLGEVETALVAGGLANLTSQGSKSFCTRLRREGCRLQVEVLAALARVNRKDLTQAVLEVSKDDCQSELAFKEKYGLEAYRSHQTMLEVAAEQAFDEGRETGRAEADCASQ